MKPTRFAPARDSTGWKWACHLCPTGDAGYLTRLGAWLVQGRHIRACQRITAAASGYPTPEMRAQAAGTKPGTPPTGPASASRISLTCDASMHTGNGGAMGPCTLRWDHDGPVHQAANGARWWATL